MNNNYRVAKCLTDNGIKEFAIFADGSPKKPIFQDENGNKYFCILNPYAENDESFKSYKKRHFYNCIRDAISVICDGYADAILCRGQDVGGYIHVAKFVDDKVAKEYRDKTLNGWKDTKFAFAVRAGSKNSFSGYVLIAQNGESLSTFSNTMKYATFETEEDAKTFAESLIEKARGYVQRVANGEYFDAVMDDLQENEGKFSIVNSFFYDLLSEDIQGFRNEDKSLSEYGYEVSQCIIPNRDDVIENEWYAQALFVSATLANDFVQYKDMDCSQIKEIIVNAFKGFYEKNQTADNLVNETTVELTDEQEFLFNQWKRVVDENRELLYPAA